MISTKEPTALAADVTEPDDAKGCAEPDGPLLPATIRVGTVTYRVTNDPDEWMRFEHETTQRDAYGMANHKRAIIALNPESTDDVSRMTLWHEVLHALRETAMGSPDWRHLGKDHDTREESIVRAFEAPT